MLIVAWIAIGVSFFVAFMLCVSFVIGCNNYDRRISNLEDWMKRAQSTISEYQNRMKEK